MRRICIVGAGQAGLQLGIGLLQHGYDVTVVSDRTPEEIRNGRVMSSQCMFATALSHERAAGLNAWDGICPPIDGISLAMPDPGGSGSKVIDWAARLDVPAQSVDQRLKMPRWMAEFRAAGGDLVFHEATISDLEQYARDYELVVVAAGKGDIAKVFTRDADRSPYASPQRALALTYVTGLTPRPDYSTVAFNMIPGVGEYFVFPALATTGRCDIMVFEGVPGGPMDVWHDVTSPDQHLRRSVDLLRTFLPWEAERTDGIALTDDNGVLRGRLTPTVREPVGRLPSGAVVWGIGDVVVVNDPITGQGSNNASRFAESYLCSIVEHGSRPFDAAFMTAAFEYCWTYVRYVTMWTNALLAPPPAHVVELLGAANTNARVAHRFVNGFDDPADYFTWFMDPVTAKQYLADVAS